ncbi:MAG: hypothetical protein KZQ76_00415 [Candidatus Thiodiazotropha sp. (ex Epidulcina cf. delphinae)]|nr:hypothetical protein [Candidatus Thiodiazotropha sp. (ex Epidulcina cf. delphinae)]
MKIVYVGLMLSAAIYLLGCQTTGDPKRGGLFSWDEKKAKQRQQVLADKKHKKQNEIAKITQKNTSLERVKRENAISLMEINNTLLKLREEQESLRNQISQLRADNMISEGKLRDLVNRYPWLVFNERKAKHSFFNLDQESLALDTMRDIEKKNKSLVEEILLLIGN